jgi:hypothetical protein
MLPSQDNFNLFLVNIYLLAFKRAHQLSNAATTTTKPYIPKQFGGRLELKPNMSHQQNRKRK